MMWRHTRCDIDEGIARITLNRADKRNVLSRDMLSEMLAAIEVVEGAQSRLLIIASEGGVFSCGGDLSDSMLRSGALGELLEQHHHQVLTRLMSVRCPTLCAVDGLVVGGACGLVLACDMVIVTDRAQFSFPFTKIGLVPDCGLSWILPRLVGSIQAKRLLLFGDLIHGEEAVRLGLASRCVDAKSLNDSVLEVIRAASNLDRDSFFAARRAMMEAQMQSFEEALRAECAAQSLAGRSACFSATLNRMARP